MIKGLGVVNSFLKLEIVKLMVIENIIIVKIVFRICKFKGEKFSIILLMFVIIVIVIFFNFF